MKHINNDEHRRNMTLYSARLLSRGLLSNEEHRRIVAMLSDSPGELTLKAVSRLLLNVGCQADAATA